MDEGVSEQAHEPEDDKSRRQPYGRDPEELGGPIGVPEPDGGHFIVDPAHRETLCHYLHPFGKAVRCRGGGGIGTEVQKESRQEPDQHRAHGVPDQNSQNLPPNHDGDERVKNLEDIGEEVSGARRF